MTAISREVLTHTGGAMAHKGPRSLHSSLSSVSTFVKRGAWNEMAC